MHSSNTTFETKPGPEEAELLEAVGLALQSVIPWVDRQNHDVDLHALEQMAARAVSAAGRLRWCGSNQPEQGPALAAFDPGSRSLRELERSHIAAVLEQCR